MLAPTACQAMGTFGQTKLVVAANSARMCGALRGGETRGATTASSRTSPRYGAVSPSGNSISGTSSIAYAN